MAHTIIPFEEGWEVINRDGIQRVLALAREGHGRPFTPAEYGRVYDTVFRMCHQIAPYNYGGRLFERYNETMNAYLTEEMAPLTAMPHDERLLSEVVARWTRFSLLSKWMGALFRFLDQWLTAQGVYHKKMPTVAEAGVSAFRKAAYDRLKEPVSVAIIEAVDRERNGGVVDLALLRGAANWMLAMDANASRMADLARPAGATPPSTALSAAAIAVRAGAIMEAGPLYVNDLEAPYLAAMRAYYAARIAGWLADDTVPAYLARCERVLEAEQERCAAFLRPSTSAKVMALLLDMLLTDHAAALVSNETSGVAVMVRDGRHADLAVVHRLFSRADGALAALPADVREQMVAAGTAAAASGGGAGGGGSAVVTATKSTT